MLKSEKRERMKARISLLIMVITLCAWHIESVGQDYSRFMKVKKWKISYEIKDNGRYMYPSDLQAQVNILKENLQDEIDYSSLRKNAASLDSETEEIISTIIFAALSFDKAFAKLSDTNAENDENLAAISKTYSITDKHSFIKGNLLFDEKDPWEPSTWTGNGKITCTINEKAVGLFFGSKAGSTMKGEGTTKLNSDESYFSIDPESGTYDIYLVPGNGDIAGINVKITSYNKLMEDMYRQIANQIGVSSENIKNMWSNPESSQEYNKPEYIDLFYGGNGEQWTVDIESRKIETKGMVISGMVQVAEHRYISWVIEPAN